MEWRHPRLWSILALLSAVSLGGGLGWFAPSLAQARPLPFADPAFQRVWAAADGPTAAGAVNRTWLWGPAPFGVARDYYTEATPNHQRLVQYFDKARMEITKPEADSTSVYYVTTGLLVKEMVSGKVQTGDNEFRDYSAAAVPVAGDADDRHAPTYASFAQVATLQGTEHRQADRTGQRVTAGLKRDGSVTAVAPPAEVKLASYDATLGHNLADVFAAWLDDPANGLTAYGSWVYVMGYPITEPYWLTVKVGGAERPVLAQLFERRVLTFTPANEPAWRVEMGNVGRAYFRWQGAPPADWQPRWSPDGQQVAFASARDGNLDLFMVGADGRGLRQLTTSPYNEGIHLQWIASGGRLVFTGQEEPGLWAINVDGSGREPLPGLGSAQWSPDGRSIAYVDDRTSGIRVRDAAGGNDRLVTAQGTVYWQWSPDSRKIAFQHRDQGNGPRVLWVVDLASGKEQRLTPTDWPGMITFTWAPSSDQLAVVREDNQPSGTQIYLVKIDGTDLHPLPRVSGGILPQWSPVGRQLAFVRAEEQEYSYKISIWLVNADGSGLKQLAANIRAGLGPWEFVWSPRGDRIAFLHITDDGRQELRVMNADGTDQRVLDSPPWW